MLVTSSDPTQCVQKEKQHKIGLSDFSPRVNKYEQKTINKTHTLSSLFANKTYILSIN